MEVRDYVEIDIKSCLNLDLTILKIAGVHRPIEYGSTTKEKFAKIYSVFVLCVLFYMYIVSEIIHIYMVLGDIEQTVQASFLLLTHLGQLVKTVNALRWRDRVHGLIASLNEPVFSRVRAQSRSRVAAAMRRARLNTRVFLSCTLPTILLWAAFPLWEDARTLPLPAWYPYDALATPAYQLTYCYQIVCTSVNACCNLAHDTVAAGLLALMAGQMDVLAHELSAGGHGWATEPPRDTPLQDEREHLKDCVIHHLAIINFLKELESLFGVGALAQFSVGCVIVCVTAFQLSLMPISVEFFSMALYMVCMLTEILLYCYYGNEIIIKSSRLADAAYESGWYRHSLASRRLLLVFMERCRRPVALMAGPCFVLSLQTFTAILRSSYSYYAVLQQVNSK